MKAIVNQDGDGHVRTVQVVLQHVPDRPPEIADRKRHSHSQNCRAEGGFRVHTVGHVLSGDDGWCRR